MASPRSLAPGERTEFAPLFAAHRYLRVGLDGVLEGRNGEACVTTDATCARAEIGPFTYLGGDASSPEAAGLLNELTGLRVLLLPDAGWRAVATQIFGTNLAYQDRISYSPEKLSLPHLEALAAEHPLPAGSAVVRLDAALAARAVTEVSDDLLVTPVFPTAADFARDGIGFCAMSAPHGGRIVSAASSGLIAEGAIEIQINTHPDFERRGYARAVACALISHCLLRGITPHWDSAVLGSQRLAEQLGYVVAGEYRWWVVDAGTGGGL